MDSLGRDVVLGGQLPHPRTQGGLDDLQVIDCASQAVEFDLLGRGGGR